MAHTFRITHISEPRCMSKNPHAVALGRKGGEATSERKAAAARANAQKPRPGRRKTKETA